MLRCFKLLILLVVAAATAGTYAAEGDHGTPLTVPPLSGKLGTPIQLFNGKNMDGWVWYQGAKANAAPAPKKTLNEVFQVRNGIMHSEGKPNGYIRYDKSFKNYVITVEERQVVKGNGGLLVGIRGDDKIWPGLEIQTMTDHAGELWNHNILKMVTDQSHVDHDAKRKPFEHIMRAEADSQKPVGEWDTMEVVVDEGYLVFKVNGVVQSVVTQTEDLSGEVGLQAEGAEMEFRKVQVTPIE